MPTGLAQKISVIAENLVVGWSGNRIAAKHVLRDLHSKSEIERFTPDSLFEYFQSVKKETMGLDVRFAGFVMEPVNPTGFTSFGYGCELVQTAEFGEVSLMGTGSGDLLSLLGSFPEPPKILGGNPGPVDDAASFALMLSGMLLNTELGTLESLRSYYGGGYEIAGLVYGRFQKVDQITYVFWVARSFDAGVEISQSPRQAFSYGYSEDLLTIQSVSFEETEEQVSTRQCGYAIAPMHREISKGTLQSVVMPSLNNKWLCNYFLSILNLAI